MQGVACTLFALMGLRLILCPSLILFFLTFSLSPSYLHWTRIPLRLRNPPRCLLYSSFIRARPPCLVFFLLAIDLSCFLAYILFPFLSPLGSLFCVPRCSSVARRLLCGQVTSTPCSYPASDRSLWCMASTAALSPIGHIHHAGISQ